MGPCVASLEPFDGTFQVLEKVAMPKTSTAGVVGAVSSNSNTRGILKLKSGLRNGVDHLSPFSDLLAFFSS